MIDETSSTTLLESDLQRPRSDEQEIKVQFLRIANQKILNCLKTRDSQTAEYRQLLLFQVTSH